MNKVQRLVYLAILCAISVVLIYLVRIPIFPSAPFLLYDPADASLIIAAYMFGPWWGLLATVAASGIQSMTVSSSGSIIGFCMHVFATGTFVIVAGIVYNAMGRNLRAMFVSMAASVLAATAIMIPLNLIFTPMYGTPIEVVKSLIWPVIVPFNLIKFGINSVIAAILLRTLRRFIKEL